MKKGSPPWASKRNFIRAGQGITFKPKAGKGRNPEAIQEGRPEGERGKPKTGGGGGGWKNEQEKSQIRTAKNSKNKKRNTGGWLTRVSFLLQVSSLNMGGRRPGSNNYLTIQSAAKMEEGRKGVKNGQRVGLPKATTPSSDSGVVLT